jgi:hypothetical protein
MSKLIFACAMLSSASFVEPAQVANFFGPAAQTITGTLRSALSIDTVMPALGRIRHPER